MSWLQFLASIMPELVKFGSELFKLFRGDAVSAKREIADRRADIAARRKANDVALGEKYKKR